MGRGEESCSDECDTEEGLQRVAMRGLCVCTPLLILGTAFMMSATHVRQKQQAADGSGETGVAGDFVRLPDFHPAELARSGINEQSYELANKLVERGNASVPDHCKTPSTEETYGELTAEGMRQLLDGMPAECALDEHSVFIDVGSGNGHIPLFVRAATNVKYSYGIEVARCRHNLAEARLRAISADVAAGTARNPKLRQIGYLYGDVRKTGLHNATHLYMASLCFGEQLMMDILRLAKQQGVRCIIDSARFMAPQSDVQRWGSAVASSITRWNWFPPGLPAFWHLRADLNPHDRPRKGAKAVQKATRSIAGM